MGVFLGEAIALNSDDAIAKLYSYTERDNANRACVENSF